MCIPPHPPFLTFPYLSPLLMSGYDSRQPSHDLMAIHPYSTLEDPYTIYPHSLRNIGEQSAHWAPMSKLQMMLGWVVLKHSNHGRNRSAFTLICLVKSRWWRFGQAVYILLVICFLSFSDELCASIVRSHRETSQYKVEELQALRWKLFCREEIQAYQSKVYQPVYCFLHSCVGFSGTMKLCDLIQTV